jgi:hypothetical protein
MFEIYFAKMINIKNRYVMIGVTASITYISGYFCMYNSIPNILQFMNQNSKLKINQNTDINSYFYMYNSIPNIFQIMNYNSKSKIDQNTEKTIEQVKDDIYTQRYHYFDGRIVWY